MKGFIGIALTVLVLLVPFFSRATEPKYLRFYGSAPTPTPTPTPSPGSNLIGAYYFVGNNDAKGGCPASLPSNAKGCAINVKWARVEPTNGTFDWSYVDNILNNLQAGKSLQLEIITGAAGTPNSAAVCGSLNPAVPACTPWLSGASGIPTKWWKGSQQNLSCGANVVIPDPTDASYIAAYRGLLTAVNSHFGGNPKISYVNIAPISLIGNDISVGIGIPAGNACGLTGSFVTSTPGWQSLSGCGSDNACFNTWIGNAMQTLWVGSQGQQVLMQNVPMDEAIESNSLPSMSSPGTAQSTSAYFTNLINPILQHQPTPATFSLFQEAFSTSNFSCNQLNQAVTSAGVSPTGGFVGQPVSNLSNNCTSVCQMGTTYSAYLCGVLGLQVYTSNFAPCSAQIDKINLAFAGTPGETCP